MPNEHPVEVHIGEPIVVSTSVGDVNVFHISSSLEGVLVRGLKPLPKPVPVRVQSSCLFGESFGAVDCDCADQLRASLGVVADEGGIVIYLYEEGRGVGLRTKIEAIRLQQRMGCDTASAFRLLGLKPDPRDHRVATSVLSAILEPRYPIELLTNNPEKVNAFRAAGLVVERRRGLIIKRSRRAAEYLEEKERVLGHDLRTGNED